ICSTLLLFLTCPAPHPDLHSFPTRRSSDLLPLVAVAVVCDRRPDLPGVGVPEDLGGERLGGPGARDGDLVARVRALEAPQSHGRSEEHTSELQSRFDLVCRLLLEKKKKYAK